MLGLNEVVIEGALYRFAVFDERFGLCGFSAGGCDVEGWVGD
jgi:hypothetical protein